MDEIVQHGKHSYLFGLLCELHLPCAAQKKRSNSTPQHEVTFYRGHRLHSVYIRGQGFTHMWKYVQTLEEHYVSNLGLGV